MRPGYQPTQLAPRPLTPPTGGAHGFMSVNLTLAHDRALAILLVQPRLVRRNGAPTVKLDGAVIRVDARLVSKIARHWRCVEIFATDRHAVFKITGRIQ